MVPKSIYSVLPLQHNGGIHHPNKCFTNSINWYRGQENLRATTKNSHRQDHLLGTASSFPCLNFSVDTRVSTCKMNLAILTMNRKKEACLAYGMRQTMTAATPACPAALV